ncbi:MAG TPA: ferrochelatase [Rubrivivax sp.]|nr:ferrochelatase [Burkholderiales bacterium]HNT39856.1 ferrochelatase [Rubrivivax sp.]
MRFRPEPTARQQEPARTAVLLVNLGTPSAPSAAALRRYLAEFLSDPRVVEIPHLLWRPILHGIILRVRPAKSAAKYRTVWMPEGSPLAVWTARQTQALQQALQARGHAVLVRHAMRYGRPAMAEVLDALRGEGATRILVLPLYPQYSGATTGSVADALHRWALQARRVPELRQIADYHDDAGYLDALAAGVRAHWAREGRGRVLVMSFHGMPARTHELGDPYHDQCRVTATRLAARLGLVDAEYRVTFQSRFGRAKWLEPYTEPVLRQLAGDGVESVDVICPGFASDCLETLEEIAQEGRATFLAAGGKTLRYIPCLNADAAWIDALAALAERHLAGWPTRP